MKTRLLTLLLVAMAMSATTIAEGQSLKASRECTTKTFDVSDFNAIHTNAVANIEYQQTSGSCSVTVSGPKNYVELVSANVKDKILYIDMESHQGIEGSSKMKITITSPELVNIETKGVGNFHVASPLQAEKLCIDNTGVGNVKIENFSGNTVKAFNQGVGNLSISGKVQTAILYNSGVGTIHAQDMKADTVEATNKGVGDLDCYATGSLKAYASGVGCIRYKGDPAHTYIQDKKVSSVKKY
jgi:hypothetical protein